MLTRRELLAALGTTLVAWPVSGRAQQAAKVPHIGFLSTGSLEIHQVFLGALKDGLRELGYVDGKNIVIDERWAGDMASDFPRLAASLGPKQSQRAHYDVHPVDARSQTSDPDHPRRDVGRRRSGQRRTHRELRKAGR